MKLYLDSSKMVNGEFDLDEPINGKYKLLSFAFTNNLYNVDDTNNKIYINENGVDLTATLTNGYNDASDLESNISVAMNQVTSGTIVVSYDSKTNKFTITGTLPIYFTFGSNITNSARKLMGFNASDGIPSITTQISDVAIDLNTYKEIFVNFNENNDRQIVGVNYFNSSLIIFGNCVMGELMRYTKENFGEQYVDFKTTKTITVKMHDLNENVLNLNSDYSIVLEKC